MGLLDAIGLTRKITRPRLEAFLKKYASNGKTLDIGCGSALYGNFFPNRTTLDIEERPGVQVKFLMHPTKIFSVLKFWNICTLLQRLSQNFIAC